jgi:hypothetical protein
MDKGKVQELKALELKPHRLTKSGKFFFSFLFEGRDALRKNPAISAVTG